MMDESLILAVIRAQHGDTRAFDLLVHRFQNTAIAYARSLMPTSAAAEDAAQDAFVQAWRDLPRLTEPAAFGAWLRRIVFKFCDRMRRSERPTTVVDESLPLPDEQGPVAMTERAEEAGRVRAAIETLPPPLREVTLLYYLTGHDTKEIAEFLGLSVSTVKNRLHAARKRLRKELWTMAETVLEETKPAPSETFAEAVLARVLREYQQQNFADPQKADRALLEEGRKALFEILGRSTPFDDEALRNGFSLLWSKEDWQALQTLLMRYLTQSLSDSETAWAYLHLASTIAMSGSAAGAVLAHQIFEQWFPGKQPILSEQWPYYPVGEDTAGKFYRGDEVRLLFLSKFAQFPTSYWNMHVWNHSEPLEFITSFLKAWHNGDYLAKVDAVLADIPETQRNRRVRFQVLQSAANACVSIDDVENTQRYIQQMQATANRSEDPMEKAELTAQALGHTIHLAQRRKDETTFSQKVEEMLALLSAVSATQDQPLPWLRTQRQALAFVLMRGNRHDQALTLWEANAADGGKFNSYGQVSYAATVWKLTKDRDRTLSLLQEARARKNKETELVPLFQRCPEFADVREDPLFLQALCGN